MLVSQAARHVAAQPDSVLLEKVLLEAVGEPAVPESAVEAERRVLAIAIAGAGCTARILVRVLVEQVLRTQHERQRISDRVCDLGVEEVVAAVVLATVLVVIPTVVLTDARQQPQRSPLLRAGQAPAGFGQAFLDLPDAAGHSAYPG